MKILHCTGFLGIGGSETIVLSSLKHFQQQTENSHLLVCFGADPTALRSRYGNVDNIKSLDLSVPHDIFKSATASRLMDIIKEFKPDLIHTHLTATDLLVKQLLLRTGHIVPVVHTLHEVFTLRNVLAKILYRYYARRYLYKSTFVAVSEHVKKTWASFVGIPDTAMEVLHNFTDYPILSREISHQPCTKLLYVGRLDKIKGIDVLLHALKIAQKSQADFALDIIGDGNYRCQAVALAARLELRNVSFKGMQPPDDYYRKADMIVVPSRTEGFGLVILEAWAFGVPVIASCSGGICEIVEDGKNGMLFANGDYRELAEALVRMSSMPVDKRIALIRASQKDLGRFNSGKEYALKISRIYDQEFQKK